MAPLFSLIRDVNPSKTQWALRLRLVRCYDVPVFRDRNQVGSTECIFHDREGDRIHATIKGAAMDAVKPKLIEGHLYAVRDFDVADNKIKFKTTSCKYKLNFMRRTNVVEFFDTTFPNNMFNFKSFANLTPDQEIEEFELFDIIGRVVSYQSPTRHPGTGSTRMEFRLEDLEKRVLPCTLWEEYVNTLFPYLEENKGKHLIVIIQFGRAKLFGDDISVSNTYHATKVIVNGNWDEFKQFENKVIEAGEISTSISKSSNRPALTISEEFNSGQAVVKTLAEISEIDEDGVYWVDATIVDIETVGDFWYLACKKCSKKLTADAKQFFCAKCNVKESKGNFRFKIEVRVVDGTGNARFLLWDKECVQLLGKSAGDLKELNKNEVAAIRAEIEETLTDKEALFKIQVKGGMKHKSYDTYNVLKMAVDKRPVGKGKGTEIDSEESEVVSKKNGADEENNDDEELNNADEEDSVVDESNVEDVDGNTKEKHVDNDKLIMKRSQNDELNNEKAAKTMKIVIKTEK